MGMRDDDEQSPAGRQRGLCRGLFVALLVVAWSLSVVSIAHCSFVKATYDLGSITQERLFGLFTFDDSPQSSSASGNYCVRYDEVSSSAAFVSARAFGILAALLSGVALFGNFAMELFLEWGVVKLWKTCAAFLFLAFLFQSLTFLALLDEDCKSDNVTCNLGVAGYFSVIAAIFLLASGSISMCGAVRPPAKPLFPISDMSAKQSAKLRWTIFAMAILTWILSIVAVADCTMIRYGDRRTQYSNMNELGLFNFNFDTTGHRCLAYDSSVEHDAATKTAQAFACLATIFSGFAMLKVIALQLFLRWKPVLVWKAIRIEVLAAILSQAIVFSGFATDICVRDSTVKCFPGPAGIINAINVALLSVLCWLCWRMAPPDRPIFEVKLDDGVSAPTDDSLPPLSNENYQDDTYNNVVQQSSVVDQEPDSGWGVTVQTSSIEEGNDSYTNVALNRFASPVAEPVDADDTDDQYLSTQYRDYEAQPEYTTSQPARQEQHHHHHHKSHKHHVHTRSNRPDTNV